MLSGNELGPRTTWEIILGFSLLMLSLGIGNLFVGEFTTITTASSEKDTFFQSQIDLSNN